MIYQETSVLSLLAGSLSVRSPVQASLCPPEDLNLSSLFQELVVREV